MSISVKQESLRIHKEKQGAIEMIGTMPVRNGDDLALAYTPGVAGPCLEIAKDKEKAYEYTIKGKTVAVVTNGTAVLGLGNIGAIAGLPVVEGDTTLNGPQREIAKITNRSLEKGTLADIIKNADVFIGVSVGNIVTKEMVESMNKDSIVFALSNPVPEIMPEEAKKAGARITATGRSDFPNQINNVLVFPGIFKGVLSVRAQYISDEMKIAAAKGLADLIKDNELNEDYIVPSVFNEDVCNAVADDVILITKESEL